MSQPRHHQAGISLVEILVTVAISAVLWASAVPSLSDLLQRQRLQGAGESFRSDFQMARMHALGTGRSVRLSFVQTAAGSCYVAYQGSADTCSCDERGRAVCADPQQLVAHQWIAASKGLRLEANVRSMLIDAQRGTVTPTATVKLSSDQGARMAHVVAITGRLRTCGDAGLPLPECLS